MNEVHTAMTWLSGHLLIVFGWLLAVPAAIHMLSQRRTPQSVWAWLILMFTFPWIGVPLYLMFGGRKMQRLMDSKSDLNLAAPVAIANVDMGIHKVLCSLGIPAASQGNRLKLHNDGVAAFSELLSMLDHAQHAIWYSTFIFANDATGRAVMQRLVDKAKSGVEVRLLLDGVGCLHTSNSFVGPLTGAGGNVAWFMPVLHRPFRGRSNLRNHRKLVIVDGQSVWSGGRNTADEYMGADPDTSRWADLTFSLVGTDSLMYQQVFGSDWHFATGQQLQFTPTRDAPETIDREQTTQLIPSGPDVPNDALLSALLTATFAARHRIWFVTPYFVPPESLIDALCLAARRGGDVRLVIPMRSNHRLADWARGPHLRALERAGGRVLAYPSMIHAKTAVFDTSAAFAGSANLDERSLLLNYELMLAVYSQQGIKDIADWIDDRIDECEVWKSRSGRARVFVETLAEMVSPLL